MDESVQDRATFTRDYFEEDSSLAQRGWLLNFGKGFRAAVAFHEMAQVLIEPELFIIPRAPLYCQEVLRLGARLLPVMDVATLLDGRKDPEAITGIIGIAVYQAADLSGLEYVGMHLQSYPVGVRVTDELIRDVPEHPALWEHIALSCFQHEEQSVPILDLMTLFDPGLREHILELTPR